MTTNFITKGRGASRKVIPVRDKGRVSKVSDIHGLPDRNIDQFIKDHELGNLEISKGGNFQSFLDRLITYFDDNKNRSEYSKTYRGKASVSYIDLTLVDFERGNLEISKGGNFENWLGNLIQFYERDTGQDKEYIQEQKDIKISERKYVEATKVLRPFINRYIDMTESAPDPEHVSGGGIDIFDDGLAVGSLYYKGTPLEKEALAELKTSLKKRGMTVKVGDLWYPA